MHPIAPGITLRFGGKKDNLAAAELLKTHGVTRTTLQQEWGVTLWTLKHDPEKREIQLKLDTHASLHFTESGFLGWLKTKIGDALGEIELKLKPHTQCCKQHCSGCLKSNGNDLKAEWIG